MANDNIFEMLKDADLASDNELADKFGKNEELDNLLAKIITVEKQHRYGSQSGSEQQRRMKIKEIIDQYKGTKNASA